MEGQFKNNSTIISCNSQIKIKIQVKIIYIYWVLREGGKVKPLKSLEETKPPHVKTKLDKIIDYLRTTLYIMSWNLYNSDKMILMPNNIPGN